VAEAATVTQLRPVRVLVAGADGAVVGHMREELLRMGFHTMSTTRTSSVADLAAVERVNVVILELSGGIGAAIAAASAIEALPHRVRILLAGPQDRAARKLGYEVIDPSGAAEELAAAVHHAYRGGPLRSERSLRS
jgi:hypothetical protein